MSCIDTTVLIASMSSLKTFAPEAMTSHCAASTRMNVGSPSGQVIPKPPRSWTTG
ncbi:hypothetical protein NM203_16760 [Mycolicibacterium sp. CAU 1645]|uniref:Uncharacterized protein n=1 Tax=Mycolicibacterium arenosum TaxID=2952157 RepID=A0ABT1M5Y2_9MYCO|nr:hypothetical protein [Mycolicibacterium sp. CAU 1645]